MKFEKLGENIKQVRGISYKPNDISAIPLPGYVPVLKANNIQERGIDTRDLIFIHKSKVKPEQFIKKGDLLLAASSGSKEIVGKNIFFENDFEGSFGAFCKLVRPKPSIHPKFVGVFFKTPYFKRHIRNLINGALINNLKNEHIDSLLIPTLSKNDQLQIADILSLAENLIAQRKESIRLLDEFLKSTFLEMFFSNPEAVNWEELKFEELADKKKGSMRTGPFGSSLLHGEFTEAGDVKVLGIDNVVKNRFEWKRSRCITNEKYQELKRYRVYPNDVLISIMATLGRTAVVPKDIPLCINSKHLAAITLDKKKANPYFIAYAFHSHPFIVKQLINNVKGAIMDGLNLTIIRKIRVKIPPIELQNKFGETFEKTEALKAQYQQSLRELENLYGSLSQRAFKGELNFNKTVTS